MYKRLLVGLLALGLAMAARYHLGTPLTPEQVDPYDLRPAVLPDGRGLPPGQGRVEEGAKIYAEKCASCHGKSGEGYPFNRLVAEPFPITPETESSQFAIGNYWQYPTTLFDYIRRAMPYGNAGSLSADEVYALVAWLLYQNGITDGSQPLDAQTLPKVAMPARALLQLDPETHKRFPWLKLP
ncbi:MAG: c-type cytochrome [Meiothermus silvanus]|nr:c-type cytochrome [Allomeiothermus silvanus]